ncbi:MAG: hypothetical protein PHX38_02885 [Sulfuricella sp.]|nr:hypothetical protein [Sulfuricella sp.]
MPDFDPARRTALRKVLAAGCALCVPVAWGTETVPGGVPKPAAAPKAGGGKVKKVSKAQAKYQEKPKGQQQCAVCNNFVPPNSCNLVEGKISPSGWCTLFTPKPV